MFRSHPIELHDRLCLAPPGFAQQLFDRFAVAPRGIIETRKRNRPGFRQVLVRRMVKGADDARQCKPSANNDGWLPHFGCPCHSNPSPRDTTRSILPRGPDSATFISLLAPAAHVDRLLHWEPLDCFSPLGKNFDGYVDALIELNRQADVPAATQFNQPLEIAAPPRPSDTKHDSPPRSGEHIVANGIVPGAASSLTDVTRSGNRQFGEVRSTRA